MMNKWDYEDLRDPHGKSYMLRFLPYLETPDGEKVERTIGYRCRRGYGYGRWEEFFRSLPLARRRMKFLVNSQAIEDAELRKEVPGSGSTLVDEWREGEKLSSHD
jgi:hypothetical protein